nr:MAG TPA: hypothetical protein [Caudoviricetes sp.]
MWHLRVTPLVIVLGGKCEIRPPALPTQDRTGHASQSRLGYKPVP